MIGISVVCDEFRLHMTKISYVKLKKKFSANGRDFISLGVPPSKATKTKASLQKKPSNP